MSLKQILIILVISVMWLLNGTDTKWRTDRRPKIMGSNVSDNLINPRIKRVQFIISTWHNVFRSKVKPSASNMLYMKWHKGAAFTARKWANKCMALTHDSPNGRIVGKFGSCGQNIFIATQKVPWRFAIETWYLEKEDFIYGNKSNELKKVGHYTQLAWASTHKVGCGLNICHRFGNQTMRKYYLYVCNYCPIGNRPKRLSRPYKIGSPCASCPNRCKLQKFCTNACPVADQWSNCKQLHRRFASWLCHSFKTEEGRSRRKNCLATCACRKLIHD